MNKNLKCIFVSTLFFTSIILGQSTMPDLITDRPDVTESAVAVPLGSFQVETGFSFQQQKVNEFGEILENRSVSLFSTLFRYGVFSNLEFRFGGGYFSNKSTLGQYASSVHGINDLMVGSKFVLRNQEVFLTNFAVLFEVTLPFGAEELKPEKFEPKFMLLGEQEINEFSALAGNVGVEYSSDLNKYLADYSLSLGLDLSDRIGLFAEIFGQTSNGLTPDNFFDCGITYLQTENLQVDFSIGSTLSKSKTEWFAGVGVALRFMK
ncbi:MAG: transporter [Melioribacteraceae bacterium]